MSLEYSPKGLIGVLVPQANTTVEPEFSVLCPDGFSCISGRMTSDKPTIEARLLDYYENLGGAVKQFSDAPLGVLTAACTGASYLLEPAKEDALFDRTSIEIGLPVTNSAYAVVDACKTLKARAIGLVSPYSKSLTDAGARYWASRGLEIVKIVPVPRGLAPAHPIYSLASNAARDALRQFIGIKLDAVVLLGTGMPTLRVIIEDPIINDVPVFSCNLASVWNAVRISQGLPPDSDALRLFIQGDAWRDKLAKRQ